MKIKLFFLILIFFIITMIFYANDTNIYEAELIKIIKKGSAENELMWNYYAMPGEPSAFGIYDDSIYILDSYNDRIVIYDLNLNFKEIYIDNMTDKKFPYELFFSHSIKFDNLSNIYTSDRSTGFYKIKDKKIKYNIPSKELQNTSLDYPDYYPVNDYVLFYYKSKENLRVIDPNGKLLNSEESITIIKQFDGYLTGFFDINSKDYNKFKEFCINNNLIFINGKIIFNYYFEKIIKYRQFIFVNYSERKLSDKIQFNFDYKQYSIILQGFDKHNNTYWWARHNVTGKDQLLIYSQFSELLTVIKDIKDINLIRIAIHNSGDIYLWDFIKEGIAFYRIRNTWDPIDPHDTTITQLTKPQVTSLIATSYNTYKNMYHPLKAFDGDIKTAWLEAAKGPGIGESITLELDSEITVDSIQVLPGLFDAKWWKSNNRVKALTMKTGDSTTTLQFQDEMKPHKADFKEPKTFKKVEFIVKEVYPSGKDDDTAITDIQFYYKGERVQLDFGKQEAELKKPK